jgi:hypothetical protein
MEIPIIAMMIMSSSKVKPLLSVTTRNRPLRIDAGYITKLTGFVADHWINGIHSRISGHISLKAAELLGLADVNRVTEYGLNRPVAQHQTDAASGMNITIRHPVAACVSTYDFHLWKIG